MKTEQTECSETSAYKIQMPGNYPGESIKQCMATRLNGDNIHMTFTNKILRNQQHTLIVTNSVKVFNI